MIDVSEAATADVLQNRCSEKPYKLHSKIYVGVLKSLFNKAAGLHLKWAKFLRKSIL